MQKLIYVSNNVWFNFLILYLYLLAEFYELNYTTIYLCGD